MAQLSACRQIADAADAAGGETDRRLIRLLRRGLPLSDKPYAGIARAAGMSEAGVIQRIKTWLAEGRMKRFGVIVRHHELGYRANAMIVWDIPDGEVREVAGIMRQQPFVTLCYRRPRRLPMWPYNLFCMIHGRDRGTVLNQLEAMIAANGWAHFPREVLFSRRCFRQRGAVTGPVSGKTADMGAAAGPLQAG